MSTIFTPKSEPQENFQVLIVNKVLPACFPVQRGGICTECGLGKLDYNGMLDLECPVCGFSQALGGGYT